MELLNLYLKQRKINDYHYIIRCLSNIPIWIISLWSNHTSKRHGKKEKEMNKQRINELGSDIRRLHNEIVELTSIGLEDNAANLEPAFNEKLLALINRALDAEEIVEKLFKLLEKK